MKYFICRLKSLFSHLFLTQENLKELKCLNYTGLILIEFITQDFEYLVKVAE